MDGVLGLEVVAQVGLTFSFFVFLFWDSVSKLSDGQQCLDIFTSHNENI